MKTPKLRLLPALLALSLLLSLSAQAALNWDSTLSCPPPTLTISGTTATCSANVRAISGSTITGTLTLYRVASSDIYVTSWPVSGTTSANVSHTHTVIKGQTYKLLLSVTVDGPSGMDDIAKSTTVTCY